MLKCFFKGGVSINFLETYQEYLKYIENRQKMQSILSLNQRFERFILPTFADYDIRDITKHDYITWQNEILTKKYSANYLKNLHFIFSGFLNYCVDFHNLENNVASLVGSFKNNNIEQIRYSFYNSDEFFKFIKCVDNHCYRTFFELMFFTGTRPGEAFGLKFSDFKTDHLDINKTLTSHVNPRTGKRELNCPKTRSSYRTIYIDKKLSKSIKKLKRYYLLKYKNTININDIYIFGGLKPLSPTSINRIKSKACINANVKSIKLHEFRHSHACLLMKNGILIHEISKRLGHSSVTTTLNIYTHTSREEQELVISTLNKLRRFHK